MTGYKCAYYQTISLLCLSLLVGCDDQQVTKNSVTTTNYSGYYNTIEGKLSDGTEIQGIGWFHKNAPVGNFCATAGEVVCSGKHSAEAQMHISGTFTCSNGTTGTFQTTRIREGDFVTPVNGSANLSDGRSAVLTFGPLKPGSGETTCFR